MKRVVYFLIISFGFTQSITAQNQRSIEVGYCVSFDQIQQLLHSYNTNLVQKHGQLETQYANEINNFSNSRSSRSGGALYVLPVVVHIIHNNGSENISDATVQQGIQDLNDAYANIAYYDSTTGVDTHIQFCLAKRDPNGNTTSGITRNVSTLTNMTMETDDISVKNLNRWNPFCYINIWLVKEICSNVSGCGVAGYAYFPSAHGTNIDGIMAEARWFGSSHAYSVVHIHEMGHYLGLYHTFQGGCTNNNCLTDGDHVCDTPPDASTAWVPCSATPNSCTTDALSGFTSDHPDLFQDYMDYSDPACCSIFTQGQADKMQWTVVNVRSSLLGCHSCLSPCASPSVAHFSSSSHSVITGSSVTFSNNSTNSSTFIWSQNGTNFSSTTSPSYTFNSPGTYIIKLTANNSDPNCYSEYSDTILVKCSAVAKFTYPTAPATVAPNVAISFTNQSTGATGYEWYVNGILTSTSASFAYTFTSNGAFWIKLRAFNSYCSSWADSVRVFVCHPCVEICDNGIDDDGNNLFDCLDPACNCNTCSDKQANVWYFGYGAGINFNTSPPTAVTSPMNKIDGTAVANDANGRVICYSNGVTVYGRDNNPMPNGTGLLGHSSAGTTLLIQHPKNKKIFYLLTPDSYDNSMTNGIHYSVIDMSLNFGMGDVSLKNISLMTTSESTEKMLAIQHCNNKDVWLIIKERYSDVYRSYLIDSNGFNPASYTISHAGRNLYRGGIEYGADIKVSYDGSMIANCNGLWELFDFNKSTGKVSYKYAIDIGTYYIYASVFSKSKKFFYFTHDYNPSVIYQYDLSLPDSIQIQNSQYIVQTGNSNSVYSNMALGPDGKIYGVYGTHNGPGSLVSYLWTINNPEAKGVACGFNANGFNLLSGTQGYYGFPEFYQSNTLAAANIKGQDSICTLGVNITYQLDQKISCDAHTTWSVSDNSVVLTATSDTSVQAAFAKGGLFYLYAHITGTCGQKNDTMSIRVGGGQNVNLGPDIISCFSGVQVLHAGTGFKSYSWNDLSADSTYTAYGAGKYWIRAIDYCNNLSTDTLNITVDSTTRINLGADTTICSGASVRLSAPIGLPSYQWTPNIAISATNTSSVIVSPTVTTVYSVSAITKPGCVTIGTRKVKVVICEGIGYLELGQLFSLAPNPALDQILVTIHTMDKAQRIDVYNDLGQIIKTQEVFQNIQEPIIPIDISNLSTGVYFMTIHFANGEAPVRKFIKQ